MAGADSRGLNAHDVCVICVHIPYIYTTRKSDDGDAAVYDKKIRILPREPGSVMIITVKIARYKFARTVATTGNDEGYRKPSVMCILSTPRFPFTRFYSSRLVRLTLSYTRGRLTFTINRIHRHWTRKYVRIYLGSPD